MAPLLSISECVGVTAGPHNRNSTGVPDHDLDKDDKNALLYIVITLLFYSMGIVVGIITYLKRERADIEEEKVMSIPRLNESVYDVTDTDRWTQNSTSQGRVFVILKR